MDFITKWVNDSNPDSERGLALFGQAGTGKSSIAHEIAGLFDKMHRLMPSFIFSRSEQSERKASYHLFTTLAHHLADRYPLFKTAVEKVVKDSSDLRCNRLVVMSLERHESDCRKFWNRPCVGVVSCTSRVS